MPDTFWSDLATSRVLPTDVSIKIKALVGKIDLLGKVYNGSSRLDGDDNMQDCNANFRVQLRRCQILWLSGPAAAAQFLSVDSTKHKIPKHSPYQFIDAYW
mgnify:CR=1 FL=1